MFKDSIKADTIVMNTVTLMWWWIGRTFYLVWFNIC